MPALVALYWKWIVMAALVAAVLWYRAEAARAELKTAEFKHAYDVLAQQVKHQNDAVQEMEKTSTAVRQRAAAARLEAQGRVDTAKRSADTLAAALSAARAVECSSAQAVEVVRKDLVAQ